MRLSASDVLQTLIGVLENIWDCKVHQHCGMTGGSLGGGVEFDDGYRAMVNRSRRSTPLNLRLATRAFGDPDIEETVKAAAYH